MLNHQISYSEDNRNYWLLAYPFYVFKGSIFKIFKYSLYYFEFVSFLALNNLNYGYLFKDFWEQMLELRLNSV